MAQYKIEFNANTCIGSLFCLKEADEIFGEDDKGYTILKNAKHNESNGKDEIVIGEELYEKAHNASLECPTLSIKVTKISD